MLSEIAKQDTEALGLGEEASTELKGSIKSSIRKRRPRKQKSRQMSVDNESSDEEPASDSGWVALQDKREKCQGGPVELASLDRVTLTKGDQYLDYVL